MAVTHYIAHCLMEPITTTDLYCLRKNVAQ